MTTNNKTLKRLEVFVIGLGVILAIIVGIMIADPDLFCDELNNKDQKDQNKTVQPEQPEQTSASMKVFQPTITLSSLNNITK